MENEIKGKESLDQGESEKPWALYIIVLVSIFIMLGMIVQAYIQNH